MMYNQSVKEHFFKSNEENKDFYDSLAVDNLPIKTIERLLQDEDVAYFCSKLFSHNSILKAIEIEPSFYYYYFEPTVEMKNTIKKFHLAYYEEMKKPYVPSENDIPFDLSDELPF